MLTPVEIQNRVFKSGGLGYDKKDVDSFMKEIVISYELLYREKMEMADKLNVLNDALQNYKTPVCCHCAAAHTCRLRIRESP